MSDYPRPKVWRRIDPKLGVSERRKLIPLRRGCLSPPRRGPRHAERQSEQPRSLPAMRPESAAPRPPAPVLFDPLPQPGEEPEPQQPTLGGEPNPPKKPRKINALQGPKSAPKDPTIKKARFSSAELRRARGAD